MPPITSLIKRSIFYAVVGILAKAVLSEVKKVKPGSRKSVLKYDGESVYRGILEAYAIPFAWRKKEFLELGPVVTALAVIFVFDKQLSDWFVKQEDKTLPIFKDFGWYFGSPENHYAINGGFYIYGLITKNENVRKTGVLLISSTCASGLLQTILKFVIGRARPLRNEGKASFKHFSNENSYYSFPSGHSILSFTTAYAIGSQFESPLIRMVVYAFGLISPFSRLWAGAHWVSDTVTSLSLSIPIVRTVDKFLIEERNYSNGPDSQS
jgi:hypothetical protein